jgi:hypothetical protein
MFKLQLSPPGEGPIDTCKRCNVHTLLVGLFTRRKTGNKPLVSVRASHNKQGMLHAWGVMAAMRACGAMCTKLAGSPVTLSSVQASHKLCATCECCMHTEATLSSQAPFCKVVASIVQLRSTKTCIKVSNFGLREVHKARPTTLA